MKSIIYKISSFFIKLLLPIFNGKSKKQSEEEARTHIKSLYTEKELFEDVDIENKPIDNNVLLSIIIPVYNVSNYLEKCIKSVMNQETEYKYEVIVVEDGSTDNSLEILKRLQEKYNFKIIIQKNSGAAVARNNGINNAIGRYITFVDSDDYINKKYVQIMLKEIIKSNSDIVICGHTEVEYPTYKKLKEKIFDREIINLKKDSSPILKLPGFPYGKVFKREIWNNIRFPIGFVYEDTIIKSLVLRKAGQISVINETLYYYLIRNNSASHNKEGRQNPKCLDQYFMQEKILELLEKLGIKNDETLYKIVIHELGTCLWLRTRFLDENLKISVFNLACYLLQSLNVNADLTFEEKYMEKSLKNFDYNLWKLASMYSMIK